MKHMLGEVEQLVLLAMLRLGDGTYGALLRREIETRTGRPLPISSIYVALGRLERKGLVRTWVGDPTPERGGRRRKHVALEVAGRHAASDLLRSFRLLSAGLRDPLGARR